MNYRFNEDQRRRLATLKVYEEQIFQVQRSALPAAAAALDEEPKISDVRDKLSEVALAIGAARDVTASLLKATEDGGNSTSAWREAFQRIERADFEGTVNDHGEELRGDGEIIERAHRALLPLARITQRALDAFKREAAEIRQRRPGTWFPVQLIDEALQAGFLEHHRATEATHGAAPPRYNVPPSTSETSEFFKVVAICYEAIGQEKRSMEAPIRAYMDWRRQQGANTSQAQ